MNRIPGLKVDVGFGDAEAALPDWRKSKEAGDTEVDPDDEQIETTEDVKAVLGFDPAEEDDEEESMKEVTMNRAMLDVVEALARMQARNRCGKAKDRAGRDPGAVENASMLAQMSPSPMLGRYAQGKKRAKNAATMAGHTFGGAEGKSLLKRSMKGGQWQRHGTAGPEQLHKELTKDVIAKRLQRRAGKPLKPMPKPALNSHGEDELEAGIKVEMEHGGDRAAAQKIALDHLREDPEYYSKLKGCGMAK